MVRRWRWWRREPEATGRVREPIAPAAHESEVDPLAPVPDVPIRSRSDDRLHRREFAELLARQLGARTRAAYVVALTGAWGSGKTSLLNMIDDSLSEADDVTVVRFNPWLFSGTEQLVTHFFDELGKQLGEDRAHLVEIGTRLRRYGRMLTPMHFVPVAGPFLETAGALAEAAGDAVSEPESLHRQREELTTKLALLDHRIVVMLDDIDRLEDEGVRDVMRLVRLVGEFPNVAYLLAFDAHRTVRALSPSAEETEHGRRYLEKIVQLSYAVPELGPDELPRLLQEAVDNAVATVDEPGSGDDLYAARTVVERLVQTVRDVRRYSNVLPVAFELVSREVAPSDILVLEALRVFLPDVHSRIPEVIDVLTDEWATEDQDGARRRFDAWIGLAGDKGDVVCLLCQTFFPGTAPFTGEPPLEENRETQRRVSDLKVLRVYLEKTLPEHVVPTPVLRKLREGIASEDAVRDAVRGLTSQQLGDAMRRLGENPPSIGWQRAAAAVATLVDSYEAVGGGSVDPFRQLVLAVTRDLDTADREAFADNVVQQLNSAVWGVRFVNAVTGRDLRGRRPGQGPGRGALVSEESERRLTESLVEKVQRRDRDALKREPAFSMVVNWLADQGQGAIGLARELLDDDDVLISFASFVAATTFDRTSVDVLFPDSAASRRRFQQVKPRLVSSGDRESRSALAFFARLLPDEVSVPAEIGQDAVTPPSSK